MKNVLVVEDSAAMRAFVRAALNTLEDCELIEARSGFEALRLLPRGPYALVITDINMPDINGLELINFIRKSEHHKTTPLVIISTESSERDRARGLELGANDYLTKPFAAEALRKVVERHLGLSPSLEPR